MQKSVHSQGHKVLRRILKDARLDAGLSQTDLAKSLGKPQSFVAKYEGGERRVDLLEFIAIGRKLDLDPIVLLRAFLKEWDK